MLYRSSLPALRIYFRLIGPAALSVIFLLAGQTNPGDEYQRAETAVKAGNWDDGIGILRGVLDSKSRDLRAINLMGLALTGKGDTREANEYFKRALAINPGFYPARKNLAVNELNLKQMAEAEQDFHKVLAAVPNDSVANMYAGELAFARKDCVPAIQQLKRAGPWLDKDPRLRVMLADCAFQQHDAESGLRDLQTLGPDGLEARWQFRAGYLLAQQDHFTEAAKFFEAARAQHPESYDIGYNLALCDVRAKKMPEAIATLTALRDSGHKTSELDNLLAEAYEASGQTQRAIDTLREATALAPEDERNYLDLAMLCADHKSFDLGLEVVNIGLQHSLASPDLLMQRGVIYAMSGKFDLAEKDFQAAGRTDVGKGSAAAGLGLAYIEQGEVVRAVDTLRAQIRKDPENATLQYLLAEALIRSGVHPGDAGFDQAREALEKSVRLNPGYVYSRVELAKIYLQQGKEDEAIRQLRAALEVDASKVQVYAQLGTALRRQGKTGEASAMFAKVRELNSFNRKHGELAPLVKGDANEDASALGKDR